MSGAALIQFKLKTMPTGSTAPYDALVFGFTTGDEDIASLSIGGEAAIPFVKGFILGDITTKNSSNISQGSGFYASYIKGRVELPDVTNDENVTLSALLFDGSVDLIGAEVWIANRTSTGVVTNLVQLGVDDFEVTEEGLVEVSLRSLSFLQNRPLFGVRTTTEILTDPTDSTNPTDPLYQATQKTPQFTGTALGGVPVSLKAAQPLTGCKFCFYKETSLVTGSIATTGTGANIVGTTANDFYYYHPGGVGVVGYQSAIFFWMRSDTVDPSHIESERFVALLKQYAEAGYRIVISDGNWFLDLTEFGAPSELFGPLTDYSHRVFSFNRSDFGALLPYAHDGVGVALNEVAWPSFTPGDPGAAGRPLFPVDGLDPSQVSFYAVPSSLSIASMQCVVDGFARNKSTVTIGGAPVYLDGITSFTPALASSEAYIGIAPVQGLSLTFDNNLGSTNHLGGIKDIENNFINTLSGSGDIVDVVMDPTTTWAGFGSPAITFRDVQGSPGSFQLGAVVYAKPSVTEFDADIFTVEATYRATFESNPAHSGDAFLAAAGPLQRVMEYGVKHTFASGGDSFTLDSVADRAPRNPRWAQSYSDITALSVNATPYALAAWAGVRTIQAVQLDVYECFVYGYSKFSFSDIYATILPFWTRGNCAAIATNGSQIVCNSGKGAIAADGSIGWSFFTVAPPSLTGREVQISSVCCVPGLPLWIMVGTEGGDHTTGNIAWSSADGLTWAPLTIPGIPVAAYYRIRYIGSTIVVMHSLGINALALGPKFDCAYNGTETFVFVGASGAAHWTETFASATSVGPGGSAALNACAWFDGHWYLGGATGTIWRATQAQMKAGTWTAIYLDPAAAITDFAVGSSSIIATTAFGIFASDDGTTWRQVQGDFIYTTSIGYGWNFGLSHTTISGQEVFVMASSAQVFTSTDSDQGGAIQPTWTPWRGHTPGLALQYLRSKFFGGTGPKWNPIQWSYGGGLPATPNARQFGLAIPAPSSVTGEDRSGVSAEKAARQICEEQWLFAGEMPAAVLDGSNDSIDVELPAIGIGQRQDLANLLNIQFQPFGGEYLGLAYIQNIDVAYVTGNDKFYFDGWGSSGLTIWQACRDSYLKTGILKTWSKAWDTVHDASVLGALWLADDADLGRRLDWIIDRPRYFRVTAYGNQTAAALAYTGARYKPNPTMLEARHYTIGRNGYGMVVDCSHNFKTGVHSLMLALPPKAS